MWLVILTLQRWNIVRDGPTVFPNRHPKYQISGFSGDSPTRSCGFTRVETLLDSFFST
jgi:hypothetical protein